MNFTTGTRLGVPLVLEGIEVVGAEFLTQVSGLHRINDTFVPRRSHRPT
jgi:hypothetical protein